MTEIVFDFCISINCLTKTVFDIDISIKILNKFCNALFKNRGRKWYDSWSYYGWLYDAESYDKWLYDRWCFIDYLKNYLIQIKNINMSLH